MLALLAVNTFTVADDKEKKDDGEKKVEARVIVLDVDGKKQTIKLPAGDGKGEVRVEGRAIFVGPDGKAKEIKLGDGQKIGDAKVRAIVIGQDGKKKELKIGDVDVDVDVKKLHGEDGAKIFRHFRIVGPDSKVREWKSKDGDD